MEFTARPYLTTTIAVIGVYSALVSNTVNSVAALGGHWLGDDPYTDAGYWIPLLTAAIHPVQNFNAVIDAIGAELSSGDPLTALGTLVSAPGSIADAVINGYPYYILPLEVGGGLLGDTTGGVVFGGQVVSEDTDPGLIGYFTDYAPQLLLQQLGLGDFLTEVTAPGSVAGTLSALSDGLNLGDLLSFDWLSNLVTMVLGALPF